MNKLLAFALVGMLICGRAAATNGTAASDASIRELLEVTNGRQQIDAVKIQVLTMLDRTWRDAGNDSTPERRAITDRMKADVSAVIDGMLGWDELLPMYIRIYRDAFTQDEIEGVLAFYKSPAGKAYVKKMPVVTQNTMSEVMEYTKPVKEKMKAILDRYQQELDQLQNAKEGKQQAH